MFLLTPKSVELPQEGLLRISSVMAANLSVPSKIVPRYLYATTIYTFDGFNVRAFARISCPSVLNSANSFFFQRVKEVLRVSSLAASVTSASPLVSSETLVVF